MKQKKLISLLLTLALLLCCLPTTALAGPNTNYKLTGQGQDDVVTVARAQLGKTGRDLGYTYEWCAAFVTWAGRTAGQNYPASDLYTPMAVAQWFINRGAGTFYGFRNATFQTLQSVANNKSAVLTTRSSVVPMKGDLVCFLWPQDIETGYNWSHIGIVTETYDGKGIIHTIEGNTGSMDTLEQRSVMLQSRNYDSSVVGIIRPNYTNSPNAPSGPAAPTGRVVNHHVEQYGGGYVLRESETVVPAGETFTVEDALGAINTYDGYAQPDMWSLLSSVRQEGALNLYYPRLYNLTVTAGSGVTRVTGSGQYTSGTEVTITAQAAPGYQLSWTEAPNLKENGSALILTMPAQDIHFEISASEAPHVGPFLDVTPGTWYADSVSKVYELGLMKGTSANAFSPQRGVTLAEAVVLAARLRSEAAGDKADFSAAAGELWYAPYASYALEHGLLSEEPDYSVAATRADVARILAKAVPAESLEPLGEAPVFADLEGDPDGEALAGEIELLCQAGVISGEKVDGKQYFNPQRPISRAEVASITARLADPSLRLKPEEPLKPAETEETTDQTETEETVEPEEKTEP